MSDAAPWIALGCGLYFAVWLIFDSYLPQASRTTVGYTLAVGAVSALVAIVGCAALVLFDMILMLARLQ